MSDPSEPLHLVHHHPGRVRVRARAFEGGTEAFDRVRSALAALPGIEAVAHGVGAGSVLVDYAPALVELDDILDVIAAAAGLTEVVDDVAARLRRRDPAEGIARAVRTVDRAVRAVGSARVGLPLVVPAAFGAAAVVSFALSDRKQLMPRCDNLLWWGYSVFRDYNSRAIAASDGGEGT